MMFSNNVASAILGDAGGPLANFKEGKRDPYIHGERRAAPRWAKWERKLILPALFMTNLNGVIFV